jgi:hypothetical protein
MTNGGTGYSMAKVKEAIDVHLQLINLGFVPHCPQLTMFCDFLHPGRVSYEQWMELDRSYIDDCDVVLRISGPSTGADVECVYAEARGIPVVEGVANFLFAYIPYTLHSEPEPTE